MSDGKDRTSTTVLYVADSGMISSTGGGRTRVTSSARQARKYNFTVRLLCFCTPGQVLRFRSLLAGRRKLAVDGQCVVYYLPRLPLTRLKWVCLLNDLYCGLAVALLCLAFRIRVVHAQTLKPAVFGLIARRIKRDIRVIADIHGATMEEYLYEAERTQIDKTARGLEKYERHVLRKANWTIFVSKALREYYEERFCERFRNSTIIPCATNGAVKLLHEQRQTLRRSKGLDDKFVVCYVGSCDTYQLLEPMCRMFKSILQSIPNAFFLILSHHRAVFTHHLEKSGIAPGHYSIEAVEQAEVFNLLQIGDVGLLLRDSSIINRVASPTKFAEYCICGIPVITTSWVGDYSEMVKSSRVGWIVDLADLNIGAEMAAFLRDVQVRRQDYINRCASFARTHLAWESFGIELARLYSTLVQGSVREENAPGLPAMCIEPCSDSGESYPSD